MCWELIIPKNFSSLIVETVTAYVRKIRQNIVLSVPSNIDFRFLLCRHWFQQSGCGEAKSSKLTSPPYLMLSLPMNQYLWSSQKKEKKRRKKSIIIELKKKKTNEWYPYSTVILSAIFGSSRKLKKTIKEFSIIKK